MVILFIVELEIVIATCTAAVSAISFFAVSMYDGIHINKTLFFWLVIPGYF